MSQQNSATDTQSILQSMLERLKISSSEAKDHEQTLSAGQDRMVCGPVVTLGGINRVEQCLVAPGGVKGYEDHTKKFGHTDGSDRVSKADIQVSACDYGGSTLDGFRPSSPMGDSLDTLYISRRWEPEKTLTLSFGNVPTLDTADKQPNLESFCTGLEGQMKEVVEPMPLDMSDISEEKLHSELSFVTLQDTAKRENDSLVPLMKPYHLRATGTPASTESEGKMEGDLTQAMGQGPFSQDINILEQDNVNSYILTEIPVDNVANSTKFSFMVPGNMSDRRKFLTDGTSDLKLWSNDRAVNLLPNTSYSRIFSNVNQSWLSWNVNPGNMTEVLEQSARTDNLASPLRVEEHTSPRASKKKSSWIDRKTKRWAQRIKERWRLRQVTVKEDKRSDTGAMADDVCERQENRDAVDEISAQGEHRDQQQVTEITVNTNPAEEEGMSCQSQFDGISIFFLIFTIRTFSDFDLNFSPINLVEEIFTGKEWSHFLLQNEGPISTEASNLPNTDTRIWTQTKWSNGGLQEKEHQISENRRTVEENNILSSVVYDPKGNKLRTAKPFVEDTVHSLESVQEADFSFLKAADILDNSGLKSRIHVSRKRDHRTPAQSLRDTRKLDLEVLPEGEKSSWMFRDSTGPGSEQLPPEECTVKEETKTDVEIIPLYPLWNSHLPPSGLLPSPLHPIDSQNVDSFETVAKKRKTRDHSEGTRHVWFAEQLVTSIPCEPSYDFDMEDELQESLLPRWVVALKKKMREKPRD
ncbi:hypothetical protein GN956_G10406 [Arapaima gigas]